MNKKKAKEKAKQKRKWERQDADFKDFRVKAPYVKRYLQSKGCDLPFYDYLDSYEEAFHRIAASVRWRGSPFRFPSPDR